MVVTSNPPLKLKKRDKAKYDERSSLYFLQKMAKRNPAGYHKVQGNLGSFQSYLGEIHSQRTAGNCGGHPVKNGGVTPTETSRKILLEMNQKLDHQKRVRNIKLLPILPKK